MLKHSNRKNELLCLSFEQYICKMIERIDLWMDIDFFWLCWCSESWSVWSCEFHPFLLSGLLHPFQTPCTPNGGTHLNDSEQKMTSDGSRGALPCCLGPGWGDESLAKALNGAILGRWFKFGRLLQRIGNISVTPPFYSRTNGVFTKQIVFSIQNETQPQQIGSRITLKVQFDRDFFVSHFFFFFKNYCHSFNQDL